MNREIKFRQAHVDKDGVFQYFTYWGTIDHIGNPSLNGQSFMSPSQSSFEKKWHQEFTGLHDKNGKEIYEGDILGLDDPEDSSKYEVVFNEGCFMKDCSRFMNKQIIKDYHFIEHDLIHRFDDLDKSLWKVIGNIYENPELK